MNMASLTMLPAEVWGLMSSAALQIIAFTGNKSLLICWGTWNKTLGE